MSLREHIEQLAADLGITIHFDAVARYRSGIDVSSGDLYLETWDDYPEESYWVALHEIGHFVDLHDSWHDDTFVEHRGVPGSPSFTAAEARAWAWALDNALPEAFPLGQVGESNIAWSITDYMHNHGWEPSEAFERIFRAIEGEEPDWFYDVTTPEHHAKLNGWARPMWAELRKHYGANVVA